MKRYEPKKIEPKWQEKWEEEGIYRASEDPAKPKRYILEYFPYPSGAAMHVGHVRNYTIGDAIARYSRMQGFNVLHPMGWDAFGLPAENYAIKNKISPRKAVDNNVQRFKKQLMQMGFSYDWSREIDSTDPNYYKWTQWFFLLLFKRKLVYQKESLQWWCPVDKTVLANEQVENGRCWRCGSIVEKKALKQWFFKITDYADRLEKDLDDVDWSDSIKAMQRNWIGKSRGAVVNFKVDGSKEAIKVFTTRPDTLFGATFIVLAPEHPLAQKLATASEKHTVEKYIKKAEQKSDIQRQETEREKTGVFTGSYAINPVNGEKIPIWLADYVLMGYGTGAIMAVPAHDERDHDFAGMYGLEIRPVVQPSREDAVNAQAFGPMVDTHPQSTKLQRSEDARVRAIEDGDVVYTGEGVLKNSGKFNGMSSSVAREKIVADLEKTKQAKEVVNYKMRDWLISRQRYWGAPIPIIHCQKCGVQPVPEKGLPVKLPEIKSYEPSGDGRSPLANIKEWVNVSCPNCGGSASRETDTMDGFACSSWYFLRFADPHNKAKAFDADKAKFWLPVNDYIGGAEHAVMHLLYARFWVKVMQDAGLVEFGEPFAKLRNHGMILAPDGQKMSKSKGNTIEPDELLSQGYGADSVRLMELFIGPWNQEVNWSVEGVGGVFRFLNRVWVLVQEHVTAKGTQDESHEILKTTHTAIKKVTEDLEELGFNTAIAALMEAVNQFYKLKTKFGLGTKEWQWALETLVQLLAPFAPHITEEMWHELGQKGSVHMSNWPKWDHKYLVSNTMTIVVQVNGKVRANIEVNAGAKEQEIVEQAKEDVKVKQFVKGGIQKTIFVPDKLVNFVAK